MPAEKIKISGTLVLQDIDGSLTNTESDVFNDALLDAYEAQGIKDICLFTSMYEKQITLDYEQKTKFSRVKIIEKLEKRGFKVHAVITPLDKWLEPPEPGGYYKLWLEAYNKVGKLLKDNDTTLEAAILGDIRRTRQNIEKIEKELDGPLTDEQRNAAKEEYEGLQKRLSEQIRLAEIGKEIIQIKNNFDQPYTEKQQADVDYRDDMFNNQIKPLINELRDEKLLSGNDVDTLKEIMENKNEDSRITKLQELCREAKVVLSNMEQPGLVIKVENKAEMLPQVKALFDAHSYLLSEDKPEEIKAVKMAHLQSNDSAPFSAIRIHTDINGEKPDIPKSVPQTPEEEQSYAQHQAEALTRYKYEIQKHFEKARGDIWVKIAEIKDNYAANGRTKHLTTLSKLTADAIKIAEKVGPTIKEKNAEMAKLVLSEFENQYKQYNMHRPTTLFGLFKGSDKNYENFLKTINSDRGDFVVCRKLAEAMQQIKVMDPDAVKTLERNPAYKTLMKVAVSTTDKTIDLNSLMTEEERLRFEKFKTKFKDTADEKLLFNILKHEITPKMMFQIFPELKKCGLDQEIIRNLGIVDIGDIRQKLIDREEAFNEAAFMVSATPPLSATDIKKHVDNLMKDIEKAQTFFKQVTEFKKEYQRTATASPGRRS